MLEWLTPLLQTGTLLLFDELLAEDGSEMKALEDWLAEHTEFDVMLLAQFGRPPSGNGENVDRRALYQVIKYGQDL